MPSIRIKTILFCRLRLTSLGSIFLAQPSIFGPFRWLTWNILCFALHLGALIHRPVAPVLQTKISESYNYNRDKYFFGLLYVNVKFIGTRVRARVRHQRILNCRYTHTNNSHSNVWICGTVTILSFLHPILKNKNCKIFYTKFKFYMGVAIESGSMNIHSSAFAYVWAQKKRYAGDTRNLIAFPFSRRFFFFF